MSEQQNTFKFSARFPADAATMLLSACEKLGVSKSELIVAGTLAEARRRMNLEEKNTAVETDAVLVQ